MGGSAWQRVIPPSLTAPADCESFWNLCGLTVLDLQCHSARDKAILRRAQVLQSTEPVPTSRIQLRKRKGFVVHIGLHRLRASPAILVWLLIVVSQLLKLTVKIKSSPCRRGCPACPVLDGPAVWEQSLVGSLSRTRRLNHGV